MKTLKEGDDYFFWTQRPRLVLNELRNHFKSVEDSTYLNDSCPSLLVDNRWYVFLPNSIHNDSINENVNTYMIAEEDSMDHICIVNTIEEVIDELQQLIENEL